MERFMRFYQAVFMNETIGFFASEKKAMEKIFTMAKGCWGETWTEEAIEEWIEDFKDEPYDEFNGTWTEKDGIDMDMSIEGC